MRPYRSQAPRPFRRSLTPRICPPQSRHAALFFDPAGRPEPRRRLRRRRTAFFVCAIFSATAFGGRPGPPGRHLPRALRRRRRRPFVALFRVETLPSHDRIAEPTSCATMSRTTVSKLFCLGILPPLSTSAAIRKAPPGGYGPRGSDSSKAQRVQRKRGGRSKRVRSGEAGAAATPAGMVPIR